MAHSSENTGREYPYGLHPDNPILCGGGVEGEVDYLGRLRCPTGSPIRVHRQGSLERTKTDYLNKAGAAWGQSERSRSRVGGDPLQTPLDAYFVACGCGNHHQQVFMDMYFRGPEMAIGVDGWSLVASDAPPSGAEQDALCPYCGKALRTPAAKQCRFCKMDWHDPNNVFART